MEVLKLILSIIGLILLWGTAGFVWYCKKMNKTEFDFIENIKYFFIDRKDDFLGSMHDIYNSVTDSLDDIILSIKETIWRL